MERLQSVVGAARSVSHRACVVTEDTEAMNGPTHVIHRVLLAARIWKGDANVSVIKRYVALAAIAAVSLAAVAPVAGASTHREGNIVQTAAGAGQFKTLLRLAKLAGLAGTLEGKGPFTVFAPTDAAFAKVPRATLAALAHNRAKLRAVLLYHVLKGKVTAAQLVKRHSVTTLNGQSLKVQVRHGVVTVGGVRVIKTNIAASNGVIHVINGVLIPR